MVINYGSDVYNQWVNHEIPFNDPQGARPSLNQIDQLLLANGHDQRWPERDREQQLQHRRPTRCSTTRPAATCTGRATSWPRQGGLPRGGPRRPRQHRRRLPDAGQDGRLTKPVLGGGDLAGIFSQDNDSAKKLVQFLASKRLRDATATPSSRCLDLAADRLRRSACYPNKTWQRSRRSPNQATEFVFDGSDQMPGEVGSGSFWRR